MICLADAAARRASRRAASLDAETRIDGFDLVAQKPGQAFHVPNRHCGADADRLDAVVDAMEQKVEPACAKPFASEFARTERRPACRYSGRWSRRRRSARRKAATSTISGGRIGSIGSLSAPNAWSRRRPSSGPKRSVSGARGVPAKSAMRSKPSRRRPSTMPASKPKRRDRQMAGSHAHLARPADKGRPRRKARQGMGCAPGLGDRGARGEAGRAKALHHVGKHRRLAAMQMVGAGGVDNQAVGRIGGDDRRVARSAQSASRSSAAASPSGSASRTMQIPDQRLRLARRHADAQASGTRRRIGGQHDTPLPVTADQDERRLRRRRGVAQIPSEAICRPRRKEERDDPWHRRLPLQNPRSLRHGIGSVRACQRARPTPGTGKGADGRRDDPPAGDARRSAAQNRSPRSAAASGEWRCRWRRSFRRQAAADGRRSSKAGPSRQRQRQDRRGEDPLRNRRERTFRRRPRHR